MGHGGSGTTILGNVAGEMDGFFHPGELRTLWDEGMTGLQRCGCGAPVPHCPVWSRVITEGFGPSFDPVGDPERFGRWHAEAARVRHTLKLLRLTPGRRTGWPALDGYVDVAGRLYAAVAKVTGARVIVDSSKRTGDAAFLRLLPGVDPFVLHVVRDPRAVAFSWRRRDPGNAVARTTAEWTAFNLLGATVSRRLGADRSMRVRYEDFVRDPAGALRAIARLVGEEVDTAFVRGNTVTLGQNHTMSGHWGRFSTGDVELRDQEEWKGALSRRDVRVVTAASLPLLARYGYPVRTGVA